MPKSRHRKNHKQKVANFKKRQQEKKNAYEKKLRELWDAEIAKMAAEQGGGSDNGGLIGDS